jgi:hypothetical protein
MRDVVMSIDPESAVLSLSEVERVEKRTRDAFYYAGSSLYLILWGLLTALGNLLSQFWPGSAGRVWHVILPVGLLLCFAIGYGQRAAGRQNQTALRILWALAVLSLYKTLWEHFLGLGSLDPRQLCAIESSFYMMGFVLAGIWVGRFFMICGATVTALIVAGYLWSGPWFNLFLAVVEGGGMILGGLYVRRIGVRQ